MSIPRMTKQKKIIYNQLCKHKDHPTADIIYDEVKKSLPKISLGTVYRNLELMAQNGKIMNLKYGNNQKRFDPNPIPHPHFRCIKCGKIEDLPFDIKMNKTNKNHDWFKERTCLGCNIEYYGLCIKCKTAQEDNNT